MLKITCEKLTLHLVWIFGLLEMITVPLVAGLPGMTSLGVKSPLEGIIVGFAGILLLFFILNRILPFLRWNTGGQVVTGISVFTSSLWNALLLGMLFAIQEVIDSVDIEPLILRQMAAGFISTSGSVLITILLYHLITGRFAAVGIHIRAEAERYAIRRFSILVLSILAGIYEAIALPIILIWQRTDSNPVLISMITGLAGGVTGSSIVVFLYNKFKFKRINIYLDNQPQRHQDH